MNYIDEIFTRADIQQIRSFLADGVESAIDPRSYKERLDSAERAMRARLHRDHPDPADYEEIVRYVYEYGDALESVYMEIGLQIGAILAAQAAWNMKTALEKDGGQ